jgi:flagellar assembly protein FliH
MEGPTLRPWPLVIPSSSFELTKEIERMNLEAENRLASVESYKKQAYEEGLKKGYEVAFEKAFKNLMVLVKNQNHELEKLTSYYKTQLPELGSALAQKVIKQEISLNPSILTSITESLLDSIKTRIEITISLNEKDLTLFEEQREELTLKYDIGNLIFTTDPTLEEGEVIVSTPNVKIEGTFDSLKKQIKSFLEERAHDQ